MKPSGVTLVLLFICVLTFAPCTEMAHAQGTSSANSVEGDTSTEFRYGINYVSAYFHYEPRYLNDIVLERDFALFKQQGFTYITLSAVWKYLEPSLGIYNDAALDDLKRVCLFAANYSLQVIIDFHTEMFMNSPKIPDWVSPRTFNTVFTNDTVHEAWLNFLNHTASYLNDVENIYSWHMMNEPANGTWACTVPTDAFIDLWTKMKTIFKSYSDRPVSIRFDPYILDNPLHFNRDPRIYDLCDYIALNWYANQGFPEQNLTNLISDIQQHGKSVMISEFGYNMTTGNQTLDDEYQAGNFTEYINLFENAGVHDILAWMWRADNSSATNPEGPGQNYDLAESWDGTPRPAFYLLRDSVPPILSVQSPENGTLYGTSAVSLNFTVSEQTYWMGYSLDGEPNVTIVGSTTIKDLPDANHSLIVYANDTAGNIGTSNTTSFIVDTTPPNITNIAQTPNVVSPKNDVRIDATIYDQNGVKSASLFYTTDKLTWTTAEMMTGGEEVWNATIPAFPYRTTVTYRIEAQDIAGNKITSDENGYAVVRQMLFQDGFNSGSFGAWTGTYADSGQTSKVQSNVSEAGGYAAQFTTTVSNERAYCYETLPGHSTVYARFYVNLNANPASNYHVFVLRDDAGNNVANFQFVAGTQTKVRLYLFAGPSTYDANFNYTSNRWYCIEVMIARGSTDGNATVWINGNQMINAVNVKTDTGSPYGQFRFGHYYDSAGTIYIDSVIIDTKYIGPENATPPSLTVNTIGQGSVNLNNTGPYNIGDVVMLTAVPSGDWNFGSWSGSLSGSANPATLTIAGNMFVTATFTHYPFSDGFDSGGLGAWTGTYADSGQTSKVQSNVSEAGGYAAQFTTAASNGRAYCYENLSGYSAVDVRFYMSFGSMPASSYTVFLMRDSGGKNVANLQFVAGTQSKVRLYLYAGPTTYNVNFNYTINTWYCVEVMLQRGTANGNATVWISGNQVINAVNVKTDTGSPYGQFRFGHYYDSAGTIYIDSVIIDTKYIGL